MQRRCVARRVGANTPRWFFKNPGRQASPLRARSLGADQNTIRPDLQRVVSPVRV